MQTQTQVKHVNGSSDLKSGTETCNKCLLTDGKYFCSYSIVTPKVKSSSSRIFIKFKYVSCPFTITLLCNLRKVVLVRRSVEELR